MQSQIVLIALGVPGGKIMMSKDTVEYQVMFGQEVGLMTEAEYDAWNRVRQAPCPVAAATSIMRSLLETDALYLYDPSTPDIAFMQRYRFLPMGRSIGPLANDPRRYQILSTAGVSSIVCDEEQAQVWRGWWRNQPLSAPQEASLETVWGAIPWALSNNLGYLASWKGAKAK